MYGFISKQQGITFAYCKAIANASSEPYGIDEFLYIWFLQRVNIQQDY